MSSRREVKRKGQLPDWHLWTAVKRTVSPLRPQKAEAEPAPALPLPRAEGQAIAVSLPANLGQLPKPSARPQPPNPADRSIEPRLRRKLGRGQVEIEGTIDLHGMRQAEARAALSRFLHARSARGDRTVLVITGKGLKKVDGDATTIVERGVLRAMLPVWLSESELAPLVTGWHSAAQAHGGEGAFYVRLRRGRP